MRRFGMHAVVALAGVVACGRFGTDEKTETNNAPDGSTTTAPADAGPVVVALDASIVEGGTKSGFCKLRTGALLCADFDDDVPKTAAEPAGALPFGLLIGPAPGGRRAARFGSGKIEKGKSFGLEQGAFHLELPATFTSAQVDFEVMCEIAKFDFVRFAGFAYEFKSGGRDSLATDIFGNAHLFAGDDEAKLVTQPMVEGRWSHVTMSVGRVADTLSGAFLIDGRQVGPPPKMSVAEKDGQILFGFGAYDISETNTDELVVWIDDVVVFAH